MRKKERKRDKKTLFQNAIQKCSSLLFCSFRSLKYRCCFGKRSDRLIAKYNNIAILLIIGLIGSGHQPFFFSLARRNSARISRGALCCNESRQSDASLWRSEACFLYTLRFRHHRAMRMDLSNDAKASLIALTSLLKVVVSSSAFVFLLSLVLFSLSSFTST